MLEAAINGSRSKPEHPSIPVATEEISRDAAEVVKAGADAVHFHVRSREGQECLDAKRVAEQVFSVKHAIPGTPVGISTGAWIIPDVEQRLDAIRQWEETLPDFVSVNFDEAGAVQVAKLILEKNIKIEAGLNTPAAAHILVESGLSSRCLRILLEPPEQHLPAAEHTIRAIQLVLQAAHIQITRLMHGVDSTSWDILLMANRLGYDTRIGFEDTLVLPNGELAPSNASLVQTAASFL